MHLADAFIQSDLHCIQVTVLHFISSKVYLFILVWLEMLRFILYYKVNVFLWMYNKMLEGAIHIIFLIKTF